MNPASTLLAGLSREPKWSDRTAMRGSGARSQLRPRTHQFTRALDHRGHPGAQRAS
jgi:hypothetical protein